MLWRKSYCLAFIPALLLALSSPCYAQSKIDSLEQVLKEKLDDAHRLKVINELIYVYKDVNDNRAYDLSKQGLELTSKTKNKIDIGRAYLNYALAMESRGEYQTSLEFNRKGYEVFESIPDSTQMSAALNNIGIAYNQIGDYGNAVYFILKAIHIDELRKDVFNASTDYVNLAESYFKSKNFSPAALWARKAYTNSQQLGDRIIEGYAAEILATILIEQNKMDSAHYFIRIAKKISTDFNNEYIAARCMSHLGKLFFKTSQVDSAKHYLKKTIASCHDKYFADVLLPSKIILSKCYALEKNWKDAHREITEALAISRKIKNRNLAMECCLLLSSIYHHQQNDTDAFRYLELASHYKDTIMSQSISASIDAKTTDFSLEREKKEKQLVLSNLLQRDEEVTRQRYILALAAFGLVSLITIIFLIRKSNIDRKVAYVQLTLKNYELARLNQEVNGLINTIVHDLKSPLNSLQGIFYLMNLELKGEKETELAQLLKQGNVVLAGGYEIVKELLDLREIEGNAILVEPEKFSLKNFFTAIHANFSSLASQKEITLQVDADDVEIESDRMLLKRVVDNLVSNAIKFSSKQRTVMVRAKAESQRIIIQIIDQGQGFHQSDMDKVFGKFQKLSARPTGGESSNGLGLAIVKLLVTRLKGTIELKTEWGKGSTFTIDLPHYFNS